MCACMDQKGKGRDEAEINMYLFLINSKTKFENYLGTQAQKIISLTISLKKY